MYDELVKRLRNCATQAAPCKTCDMTEDGSCSDTLMKQAADAIEELNSQLDDFKRLCLPLKENRLYKYSDGNFEEVFLILPSEPQTNADRIRSMTDEELAEWLNETLVSPYYYLTTPERWLGWLKQEVSE